MDGLTTSGGLVNVTNATDVNLRYPSELDLYCTFSPAYCYTVKYVPPIFYAIGFPSNALAFMIWIQPRMRPSSGIYLTALALADFIFLLLQMIYELNITWNINTIDRPVMCQIFPTLFYTSQYLNPCLMLAFTVERYIAICHPFQREKLCTTARAIKVSIFLVLLCLAMHSIQMYFWQYTDEGGCSPRDSVYQGGATSIWSVWGYVTELLAFGVVPLTILILNIRVILEARKIKASEEKIMRMLRGQKVTKPSGPSATTLMLLAVSFYMIVTTLPVTIMYVLQPLFPKPLHTVLTDEQIRADHAWRRHFEFTTIKTMIERFGISHYACNFFIYLATGQVFRQEVKFLFLRMMCQKTGNRSRNSELDDLLATYRKPSTTAHSQNGVVSNYV